MFYSLDLELLFSAQNVLDSDFTTKQISEACNLSQTTINELRSRKRMLEKTSLQNAFSLYHFAVQNQMDTQHIKEQERKGKFSSISLDIPISKIMVSFEDLDLFAYGILKENYNEIEYEFPCNHSKLKPLYLSTAVFITRNGKIYDCAEFGHAFKCRYNGTGPNNLIRFIQNFSTLERKQLEATIYSNSVVEYNFQTDTITGYPSLIEGHPITLFSYNEKLIIMLNKYDNATLDISRTNISLKSAASDILSLSNILEENYKLPSKIININHVPRNAQNELYSLRHLPRFQRPENGAQIIIEYEDYEIWIPYKIYLESGDIFKSKEMSLLLEGLGLKYNPEKKSFIQTLFNSKEDLDKISRLPVYYNNEE